MRINYDERDDDKGDVGQVAHDRPKAKECAITTRLEWLHRQVLRHLLVKLVSDPRHEVTHRADDPANATQRCATTAGRGAIVFVRLLGGFVLGLVVVLVIIIVVICRLAVIPTILAVGVILIITSVLLSLTAVILRPGLLLPRDRDSDGIIHLVVRVWLNKDIFHIRRLLGT